MLSGITFTTAIPQNLKPTISSLQIGSDWIAYSLGSTPDLQYLLFKGAVEAELGIDPQKPLSQQFDRRQIYEMLTKNDRLETYLLARCSREHPLSVLEGPDRRERLTYDQIALRQVPSVVKSTNDVVLKTNLNGIELGLPIVNAPMNTVVTPELVNALIDAGGLAMGHRFHVDFEAVSYDGKVLRAKVVENPHGAERQAELIRKINAPERFIGVIGLVPETKQFELGKSLLEAGCKHLLTDVNFCLHESNNRMLVSLAQKMGMIDERGLPIAEKFSGRLLVSGCIDDELGLPYLFRSHVTAVRVGVANGAGCSTGDVTLFGIPSASATSRIGWLCDQLGMAMIADGGYGADRKLAAAIAFNAQAVMLGSRLAGTSESNASVVDASKNLVVYHGAAQSDYLAAERAFLGLHGVRAAHGRIGVNVVSGSTADFLAVCTRVIRENIASMGAASIQGFQDNANTRQYHFDGPGRWVRVDPYAHAAHRGNGTDKGAELLLVQS